MKFYGRQKTKFFAHLVDISNIVNLCLLLYAGKQHVTQRHRHLTQPRPIAPPASRFGFDGNKVMRKCI